MRTTSRYISIPATILALTLQGCGGGGGGGGDDSSSSISYSGVTTEAQIDADNANTLALTALAGIGNDAATAALAVETSGGTTSPALAPVVNTVVAGAASNLKRLDGSLLPGTAIDPDTQPCSGGGTSTVTGDINDNTGDISGDIVFSSCVESGDTLDGKVHFSGTVSLATADLTTPLKMTMYNLRVYSGSPADLDVTSSGSMSCVMSLYYSSDTDCTLNLDSRDNLQGVTYRYQNLKITEDYAGNSTLDGRIFHPDYGYVDVSTITTLTYSSYIYWPSAGELRLDGLNNSAATLTALDSSQYMLAVDADGDSAFETTDTHNWP